ncbi:hypothetical protein ACJMK2_027050 [Sinanodonta woodiana]|uniref:Uncharacterized protein n=1 Tax=Sinanodonta woodiana TaxID=1069815 RepID=A0ABD3XLH3_SINWO
MHPTSDNVLSLQGTHVLKLQAGREAGTYYACTTGPALRCARSSDPKSEEYSQSYESRRVRTFTATRSIETNEFIAFAILG